MWLIQRAKMETYLNLYEEVLHATSWLVFNVCISCHVEVTGFDALALLFTLSFPSPPNIDSDD